MSESTITDTDEPMVDEYPIESIHWRLVRILAEMPAIGKTHRNTQQNFNYRSHDDVLTALNPLLAKYGVIIIPTVIERVVAQRTTRNNSILYEVNLHVRFRFYPSNVDPNVDRQGFKTGESYVEASAWGEGTDSGDKSTNKAMTMAFKNVIAQVFAISTDVTIDTDVGGAEETYSAGQAPGAPPPATPGGGRQQRQFDVAKDLMPGAIKVRDEKTMSDLRAQAAFVDPTIEPRVWQTIENEAREETYGPDADLTPAQWGEHFTRWANFVRSTQVKAAELGVDFPERPLIVEMLARAYAGFSTNLLGDVAPESPETPADDPGGNGSRTDGEKPDGSGGETGGSALPGAETPPQASSSGYENPAEES